MKPLETLAYFKSQQETMIRKLQSWVEIESPTTDKTAVDSFCDEIASALASIGMSIEIDSQPDRGNHLVGRWIGKGPKIMLMGHLDTVWDIGTLERLPFRHDGEKAYGPGVFDMKGGIVIAFFALQLLREHGLHHSNITFVLNSDEEEGSNTSRGLIEREAKDASCVFVFEPAGPDNAIKTKRRGVGEFIVRALGRSAHAGIEPEKGISAIEELSRQILEIQSWNRERPGISANVDLVHGGTRSNVIPAEAYGVVDVRCDSPEDVAWLAQRFKSLKAHHPEARLQIEGGVNRPPLVRSDEVITLFKQASEIGSSFNYSLKEYWTGGASDGNLTSSLGIPTLDGLGAEGAGAHADHEQIIVSSLPKRANLIYHLIRQRLAL